MMEMFRYLTGIIEKEDRKTWKMLIAFSFIAPIVDVFSFSSLIYIVNTIVNEECVSTEMIWFALFMGIVSIVAGLFELYKCELYSRLEYYGAHRLSVKIYELFIKEDLLHHNQKDVIQTLSMVRTDTQNCIDILVICVHLWPNLITMAGCFVVLIYVSKWIGVISCILLIIFIVWMFYRYRTQIQYYGESSRRNLIKTNAQVTIAYGIFKEMKLSGSSDLVLERYQNASREYAEVQRKFKYRTSVISVVMQNSVMCILFMLLAFLMWRQGEALIHILVSMVVYITILIRVIPLAYFLVDGMNKVEFKKKSYDVLKENLKRYDEIQQREMRSGQIRRKKIAFQKGIQIRNLSFQYNAFTEIFKDASLDIPRGYTVALIGVSGAGKTTLLDLVLGLLKPQSGSIWYDDYDIVSQSDTAGNCQAELGAVVSYIPQIVYLNGETIRNNVAFFDRENEIDDDRVIECLKYAQIWEDVVRMPEGIYTLIGENGTALSGGQRQRIALARALYKEFELLVMDEATAALDVDTEKAVIDSIRKMKGDKVTILIATHHMSLANECDSIYKIENQKLIQVK